MENKTKKSKGRPSGSANTTVIRDKSISPYIIYIEDNQSVLVKIKDDGNEETYGYFSTLAGAMQKIAKLKTINNKTYSLKEYIDEYNNNLTEFLKIVNV